VTFGAGDLGMPLPQREPRLAVLRQPECGRLETAFRVARIAVAPLGSRGKLAFVWIRFMTVSALGKRQRLFEISLAMA